MLRKQPVPLTNVRLILHNAGDPVEAPILNGYYLVGRDQECQIRPKSSSIANRHCLLEHRAGLLRVFDLQSETGTHVNGEKITPHAWRFLRDQDRLRCGKVEFLVSIAQASSDSTTSRLNTSRLNTSGSAENEPTSDAENEDDDFDLDAFTLFDDAEGGQQLAGTPTERPRELLDMDSDIEEEDLQPETVPAKAEGDTAKTKPKKKSSSLQIPKGKSYKAPKVREPLFSKLDFSDTEGLKTIGSIVLIVAALSVFAFQLYRFTSPSTPPVVSENYLVP